MLCTPAALGAETLHVGFRGYANNVRVRPPLVGAFQLGVARIHGSADLGTTFSGTVSGTNIPQSEKYPRTSFTADVVSWQWKRAPHSTAITARLGIKVIRTNARKCAAGDTGVIRLRDSSAKRPNGENQDYITVTWANDRCPGFHQGWTNGDGGERTSPSYGGPPHGGQWAIVNTG